MKNIFYILLLLPTIIFAQYPNNSGQKITLGEQTTADGLVWRGRTSDTANLMTNKLDTSVYLVLDTMTEAMWLYRVTTTPKWNRVVDSLNNMQGQLSLTTKVTGTLPVANGGTNRTTMPAGYILHGDGTSVDTAVGLFWDRSLRYLGVGTTSPALDITINSSSSSPAMAFAQSFTNTSAQRGGFFWLNNNNSTVAAIIAQAVTDNVGTGLEFYTRPVGGANTLNMVLKDNGNVGIGTTSPDQKLVIANSSGSVYQKLSADFGNAFIGMETSDDSYRFLTSQPTPIQFYTNNALALTIASTGAATFSGSVTAGTGGYLISGDNSIFLNNISGTLSQQIKYQNSGTTKFQLYLDAATNSFGVYNNNQGSNSLTITSTGNVGIGTASPDYKLVVQGSASSFATIFSYDNAANAAGIGGGIGMGGVFTGTLTTAWAYIRAPKDSGIDGDFAGALTFHTRNSTAFGERMRITSTGNVGIGRTPTTNALEVNGDASKTTVGSWAANSDSTIKTEIHTIEGALDRINKVRLVSFKYKDDYKFLNPSIKDKFYQNVIAQEFQKIYPDYVYQSGDIFEGKNILQVDTNPMYIDAVASIQELSILLQELQSQIDILKQEIINLKNK